MKLKLFSVKICIFRLGHKSVMGWTGKSGTGIYRFLPLTVYANFYFLNSYVIIFWILSKLKSFSQQKQNRKTDIPHYKNLSKVNMVHHMQPYYKSWLTFAWVIKAANTTLSKWPTIKRMSWRRSYLEAKLEK